MATFITLLRFTQKGIEQVQESPKRATTFKAAAKKIGVKVEAMYWTLGEFDGVIVFDAPSDETATAAMLQLSSQGFVHTTTTRAYGSTEIGEILGLLATK